MRICFVGPSFPDNPLPLIESGRRAAQHDLPSLRPSKHTSPRTLPPPPGPFTALSLDAPDPALRAMAQRAFRPLLNRAYDPAAVAVAIDKLFSTGLFEGVWPRTTKSSDSTLFVRLNAPPHSSLSAGAFYENDRGGNRLGNPGAPYKPRVAIARAGRRRFRRRGGALGNGIRPGAIRRRAAIGVEHGTPRAGNKLTHLRGRHPHHDRNRPPGRLECPGSFRTSCILTC